MGLFLSKLYDAFSSLAVNGKDTRLVMLGLDAAGKTTILYKVKLNENVATIPTIGFNVETVQPVKGLNFTVWDVGGQTRIRPLWQHYYQNTEGLIYVVDSNDRERIAEAREELFGIFENDEMRNCPVVVMANKQDLPQAMSPSEIVEALHLRKLGSAHKWHVQGCTATSGEGIYESFDAIARFIKENR